ncbi:MAG: hypothetical protein R2843_06390 [Thermomicrobiales bacterium]
MNVFAGHITEPPAGHGVRLGQTVERKRSLPHTGAGGDADVLVAVVDDLLVHLVGVDDQIVLDGDRAECVDLFDRKNAAGRVVLVN